MTSNIDVLAKSLYSTVLTDLGQSSHGNALMTADGVKYLAEYADLMQVNWDDGGLGGTPVGGKDLKNLDGLGVNPGGVNPTAIFGQVSAAFTTCLTSEMLGTVIIL
jgi:hypothetical protein